jgi:hypothetical protein
MSSFQRSLNGVSGPNRAIDSGHVQYAPEERRRLRDDHAAALFHAVSVNTEQRRQNTGVQIRDIVSDDVDGRPASAHSVDLFLEP